MRLSHPGSSELRTILPGLVVTTFDPSIVRFCNRTHDAYIWGEHIAYLTCKHIHIHMYNDLYVLGNSMMKNAYVPKSQRISCTLQIHACPPTCVCVSVGTKECSYSRGGKSDYSHNEACVPCIGRMCRIGSARYPGKPIAIQWMAQQAQQRLTDGEDACRNDCTGRPKTSSNRQELGQPHND